MVFPNDPTMSKKAKVKPVTVELPPLPVNLPVPQDGVALTPAILAALAREVAIDFKELSEILKVFKLSLDDYEKISKIPFYANALKTAVVEWNSADSTHDRLRIEAAAILEDAFPGLSARMKNRDEAFPAAIEAGKLFAKIAGLGESNKAAAGSGEKFVIQIDLGADTKLRYEKDVTPVLPVIEQEPSK
jgi:hypothetical protein